MSSPGPCAAQTPQLFPEREMPVPGRHNIPLKDRNNEAGEKP